MVIQLYGWLKRGRKKMNMMVVAVIFGFIAVGVAADGNGDKKPLRSDVFGNVYVGDSPFAVGKISPGSEGELRTDVFGNVYVGNSPFAVGKVERGDGGPLRADVFDNVYSGDSPFTVGNTDDRDEDYLPIFQSPP